MTSCSKQGKNRSGYLTGSAYVLIVYFACQLVSQSVSAQDSLVSQKRDSNAVSLPAPPPVFTREFFINSDIHGYYFPGDSVLTRQQVKKRVRIATAINVVGYSAAMVGLYAAWYSNYERTGFHT